MSLKEHYAMPLEMVIDRGDGSRELLWCTSGTLQVRKGDQHIATIRSDLGNAPVVGEIAFILGIVQPYTVSATSASEVTLLVLAVNVFEEIIGSYPEQADVVVLNLLRHFSLSKDGMDTGGGVEAVTGEGTMADDEREEWTELRATVRQALLDRNDEALTEMTYAASEGDVDTVRALAARGLNLNAGDYDDRTTMHLACAEGNSRVVALLCQLGADPNVRDRWGNAPIMDAVDGRHDPVLEVLRQNGVTLDVREPAALLCDAVGNGDLERLNRLLENGISANLPDYDGRTSLHIAAAAGNMRVLEFLVSKLADVSAQDRNGGTPVDDGVESERPLVTQLLVRAGSRPNPLTMLQKMCEAAAEGDVGTVRFMVETGVSVDAGDYDGRTALHLACAAGSISTTHLLIGAMADVNATDRWSNTPIVDALWTSNECAALLVQQCNAQLPKQHQNNALLLALYAAAKAQDMYITNRKLGNRTAARRRLQLLRRDRSRELRLAIKELVDELGVLYRANRSLFNLVNRQTDRWIDTYAYQGDSNEGSQDGDSDSSSQDSSTSEDENGEVLIMPEASGDILRDLPNIRRVSTDVATAQTFIRLVLRLPRAEQGLRRLRALFGSRLAESKFARIPAREERLTAELEALTHLLSQDLRLNETQVKVTVDEIFAELKVLLGSAAPRRPRRPRRPHRMSWLGMSPPKRSSALQGDTRDSDDSEDNSKRPTLPFPRSPLSREMQPPQPQQLQQQPPSPQRPSSPQPRMLQIRSAMRASGGLVDLGNDRRKNFSSEAVERAADRTSRISNASSTAYSSHGEDSDDQDLDPSFISKIGYASLFCSTSFVELLATGPLDDTEARGHKVAQQMRKSPRELEGKASFKPRWMSRDRVRPTDGTDTRGSFPSNGSSGEFGGVTLRTMSRHVSQSESVESDFASRPLQERKQSSYTLEHDSTNSSLGDPQLRPMLGGPKKTMFKYLAKSVVTLSRLTRRSEEAGIINDEQGEPPAGASAPPSPAPSVRKRGSPWLGRPSSFGSAFPTSGSKAAERAAFLSSERSRLEIGPAAELLQGLFGIFDTSQRNQISIRDLRSLQGTLGEMGSSEIKSLIGHLSAAATSLQAPTDFSTAQLNMPSVDSRVQKVPKRSDSFKHSKVRLSRVQFFAGAAAWILAHDEEEAAETDSKDGSGSPSTPHGTHSFISVPSTPRPENVPRLSIKSFPGDGGLTAPSVGERAIRLSATSLQSSHLTEHDRTSTDGPESAHPPLIEKNNSRFGRRSGTESHFSQKDEKSAALKLMTVTQRRVVLDAQLCNSAHLAAIADAVQLRLDAGRLRRDGIVDSSVFVSLIVNTIAVDPALVRREDVEAWALASLSLEISEKGEMPDKNAARRGSEAHNGARRGSEAQRRPSVGLPRLASASLLTLGLSLGLSTALPTDPAKLMRASWRELLAKLRSTSVEMRTSGVGGAIGKMESFAFGDGQAAGGVVAVKSGGYKRWYILLPSSPSYRLIELFYRVCFMWEILQQPASLAFWEQTKPMHWLRIISYILDSLYLCRMGMRFFTSYVNAKSVIVYDPLKIRMHYLVTDFVFDLFTTWPLNLFALALGAPEALVVSLRLLRLGLCRYLWRSYVAWDKRQADNDLIAGIVRYIGVLLLASHFAACMWNALGFEYDGEASLRTHTIGEQMNDPDYIRTWPGQYNGLTNDAGLLEGHDFLTFHASAGWMLIRRYSAALYLVLSMLSGLGLNQLPANYIELVFYVLMLVLSMTIYAWTVGQISALVMKQDNEIVTKRSQLELVHGYLTHIDVPAELKTHVESFFQARLRDASFSSIRDEDIANAMPIALQIEVSKHTNRQLVGEAKLLRGCSEAFVDRLSSLLRERSIEAETTLFREGEVCKELYFLESGSIEQYNAAVDGKDNMAEDDDNMLATAGDTVGELAFVFGVRHFASGRTVPELEAHVFVLSLESYKVLLKTFPQQEDKVMDNAMLQYDGMLTSRSGRSKASNRSSLTSLSGGGGSDYGGSVATSQHSIAKSTANSTVAELEGEAIQRVIKTAKKRRENMHVLRLCDAAAKGELEKMQRILSANRIDVNRGDYDKRRPLHLAACEGHVKVIELLLSAQADINVKDRFEGTPLADALRHSRMDAAALLHRHGAFRDTTGLSDRLCFCAAAPGRVEELKLLMAYQADFVTTNSDARTPLHVAAAIGNIAAVRMLVHAKVDINALDRRGSTPLQDSYRHANDECSKVLLAHGANMGTFDAAMHLCYAAAADDVDTLRRLLIHRCEVNAGDYDKRTPLHLAASNARVAACTLLLEQAEIDANAEDRFGNTALDDAEREQGTDQPIVRALLRARGLTLGSHVMFTPESITHAEEMKADAEAKSLEIQRSVTDEASRFFRWARNQSHAMTRMQQIADEALQLEIEQGQVLSDARPKYWHELQDFADQHAARIHEIDDELRPATAGWSKRAAENHFELTMINDVQRRLVHLSELHHGVAKHFERLGEAQFGASRDPAQQAAAFNAASNAGEAGWQRHRARVAM